MHDAINKVGSVDLPRLRKGRDEAGRRRRRPGAGVQSALQIQQMIEPVGIKVKLIRAWAFGSPRPAPGSVKVAKRNILTLTGAHGTDQAFVVLVVVVRVAVVEIDVPRVIAGRRRYPAHFRPGRRSARVPRLRHRLASGEASRELSIWGRCAEGLIAGRAFCPLE